MNSCNYHCKMAMVLSSAVGVQMRRRGQDQRSHPVRSGMGEGRWVEEGDR